MPHSGFPKFEAGLVLLGFTLMLFAAGIGALLLLGQSGKANIEYSVRKYGASRGNFYTVHYVFQSRDGRDHRGAVTVRRDYPPAGTIGVRYLPFWPGMNFADGTGGMAFYGVIASVPGLLLTVLGMRLLHMKRGTAAQRKRG